MTTIDPTKMEAAKGWAKRIHSAHHPDSVAAAEVIAALPDEWIDAEKVRVLLDRWATNPFPTSDEVAVLNDVKALLAPPLPTLADMTDEERQACRWMQCEVAETANHYSGLGVILSPGDVGRATNVIAEDGGWWLGIAMEAVTPLPDMPRMVWPDEHHPADAEETPEPSQPRPEDVPAGEVWLVEFDGQQHAAERGLPGAEKPWWLMFGWRVSDSDITLVSRLVPEERA